MAALTSLRLTDFRSYDRLDLTLSPGPIVLFGANGGPGNRGMVPGLYMYREAFASGRHGYACALGMVLFAIILGITMLYQKYVRVEK